VLALDSASVPFTSLWQHVLPDSGLKQTMSKREFHTTCKIQLLIPIMEGGISICVDTKRLAKAYSVRSGKPYADCLSVCCRRICFSIRLGVARQLTASKMFLL
jgi:hypothetical protein